MEEKQYDKTLKTNRGFYCTFEDTTAIRVIPVEDSYRLQTP
jgi:hypothetical protein